MYGLQANYSVERNGQLVQEFPYRDPASMDEQYARALARYESERANGGHIVLTRLSVDDLCEGDYAPTLLRDSAKPEYSYDGFADNFGAFSR